MSGFGRPGEQLKLFAPASEIVAGMASGELGSHEGDLYEDSGSMMRQKSNEAKMPYETGEHGAGVHDSIKKHGFKGHVSIDVAPWGNDGSPALWEGHHRLAAANDLGEQFVGIDYIDPNGGPGRTPERDKPSYESRYPQNVSDMEWSGGTTLDGPKQRGAFGKKPDLFNAIFGG